MRCCDHKLRPTDVVYSRGKGLLLQASSAAGIVAAAIFCGLTKAWEGETLVLRDTVSSQTASRVIFLLYFGERAPVSEKSLYVFLFLKHMQKCCQLHYSPILFGSFLTNGCSLYHLFYTFQNHQMLRLYHPVPFASACGKGTQEEGCRTWDCCASELDLSVASLCITLTTLDYY